MMTRVFKSIQTLREVTFLGLLALLVWITPCLVAANEDDDHNGGEQESHEDIVKLTQAELDEFGIEVSTAGSGTLRIEIEVPGEVVVNNDKLAHIAPRFPGVVKKVNKRLGDKVKTGEVLAVIESNEGLVSYNIKSLIDGIVIEKHITIGEVRSDVSPVYVVANIDTVWVNLSIYQMHLAHVKVGQKVTVSSGREFANVTGVISYLSPIIDEHTRTATARVVLPNYNRNWRPGLFVEGTILANEESVPVLVPKSSIQKFEGGDVIFVSTREGFVPSPVKVGRIDMTSVEILSGLAPNQQYVSQGGFTLKSELDKSSLSSGHSH